MGEQVRAVRHLIQVYQSVELTVEPPTRSTVQDAIRDFLASAEVQCLQPKTQYEYTSVLRIFGRWCANYTISQDRETGSWNVIPVDKNHPLLDLHQITNQVVYCFLEDLKKTHTPAKRGHTMLSQSTLLSYVKNIKCFLSWCACEDRYSQHIQAKTLMGIKRPKVSLEILETFTSAQIDALRVACAEECSQTLRLRDEAIILLLLATGIRASELCTLTMSNVHLSPHDPHITILGKGRKWATVGIGKACRSLMSQYLETFRQSQFERALLQEIQGNRLVEKDAIQRLTAQRKAASPFFLNRHGKPLTPNGLEQILSRLGQWAQIEGVRCSPHTFRHTFAVLFMKNGGDIYTLSKLMRHTSIRTTEQYLRSIRHWEIGKDTASLVDTLILHGHLAPVEQRKTGWLSLPYQLPAYHKHYQAATQEEEGQWSIFLLTWHERLQATWLTAAHILATLADSLPDAFQGLTERQRILRLGVALHKRAGICSGETGLALQCRKDFHNVYEWQVHEPAQSKRKREESMSLSNNE